MGTGKEGQEGNGVAILWIVEPGESSSGTGLGSRQIGAGAIGGAVSTVAMGQVGNLTTILGSGLDSREMGAKGGGREDP